MDEAILEMEMSGTPDGPATPQEAKPAAGPNIALNIVLVPRLGIVGASLASFVSYTVQAAFAVFFASRVSGQRALSLFMPGRDDLLLVAATARRLLWRVAGASKPGNRVQV